MINNGIQNPQTEIINVEIANPQNVSKESHYHTSHTDFMYQGNITNNDNRRQFVTQSRYFTYQRKGNHEVQIQALNLIAAGSQNQINNSSTLPNDDTGIGTIWFNGKRNYYLIIMYTNMWLLLFVYIPWVD